MKSCIINVMTRLSLVLAVSVLPALATHVAVLETTAPQGVISLEEKQYLTDVLRSEAVKALPAEQNYTIMTRENINMMLPPGKAIEDCEGSCLVETGKNISADYIAQGHVGRFANNLTITVELYETAGNKLMGSFSSKAPGIESLEIEIRQKSQDLFSKIVASSYGKLDIQPVLVDKVGLETELVVKIDDEATLDGRKYARGIWEISPGQHTIEFSHRCYETLKFKVNVLSGKTTTVNNALDIAKGWLSVATEYNGDPREVPVFVDGALSGFTPFQGSVSLCGTVEVGDEGFRETVALNWNAENKIDVVHKLKKVKPTAEELRADSLRQANQLAAEEAAREATQKEKSIAVKVPVSIALLTLGLVGAGLGLYENMVLDKERKKYNDATYTQKSDFDDQWDKVKSAEKLRNIFYGVGGGLVAAGITVMVVF